MEIRLFGNMKSQNFKKTIFIIFLIIIAILERLWFDLGPNVELITTAAILTTIILGKQFGMIVPLFILGITDIFLGNNPIMLFTWSAFILEVLMINYIVKKISFQKRKLFTKLFSSMAIGGGASIWFYLWTNFGVWLMNSWGMYPRNLLGLISCYIAGLPFLKLNLFSNLLFVPFVFLIWDLVNTNIISNFSRFFHSYSKRLKI